MNRNETYIQIFYCLYESLSTFLTTFETIFLFYLYRLHIVQKYCRAVPFLKSLQPLICMQGAQFVHIALTICGVGETHFLVCFFQLVWFGGGNPLSKERG